MSTAHDAPAAKPHDTHAHAIDLEPVMVLPADEPRTPGIIPALGILLFVITGVALLAFGDDDASASATPTPEKTAVTLEPPSIATVPAVPAGPGGAPTAPAVTKLSPEQAKALQQRIEEARAKQAAQGGQPSQPGAGGPIQPQPRQPPPALTILPRQPPPGGQ